MTVNAVPLMFTLCPRASRPPKSSVAVVEPSTVTAAASLSSAALKNRPWVRLRARTGSQSGVVPTTFVVQFVVPAVSDCEPVTTGATLAMSGATTGLASAVASRVVRVDADPRPPRIPLVVVVLPGETMSRLLPSWLIWSRTWACAPWPSPTVSITAAMPIRMPSMVSDERIRRERMASRAVRNVSPQVIAGSSATRGQRSRSVRQGSSRRAGPTRPPRARG